MAYSEKVIDHFNNPRNIGSLNKDDQDVGTGIVGAPECFPGHTFIATADGTSYKTLKEIFEEDKDCLVWSFSRERKVFEIRKARAILSGKKKVDKITFNDGTSLLVTPEHEFLLRPTYEYKANSALTSADSIRPFRKYVSKRGYWRIRDTTSQYEYLALYKYQYPAIDTSKINVHHKDHNKKNDLLSNLEGISRADHIAEHRDHHWDDFSPEFSEREIKKALEDSYARPEAANNLGIYADELYKHIRHYGMGTTKRKTLDEVKLLASERMKKNNPYK
jgi:hypothetical protein